MLGSENKWRGYGVNRAYKSVNETMMYVPLLHTLQTLLEDRVIFNEVIHCVHTYPNQNDFMYRSINLTQTRVEYSQTFVMDSFIGTVISLRVTPLHYN